MKELISAETEAVPGGVFFIPIIHFAIGATGPWLISAGLFGLGMMGFKGRTPTTEELVMHQFNYDPDTP